MDARVIDRLRRGTSVLLVSADGRFLLQQRDNLPHVSDRGAISLFGGRREGKESFLQCAVREVHEEIGHYLAPGRFRRLGSYIGPDPSRPGGRLHGEVFVVRDVPVDCLSISEGCLRIVAPAELEHVRGQLSPSASYALELFFRTDRAVV